VNKQFLVLPLKECLSFEKSEDGIMNKKPRGINKPLFTPFIKASIA